MEYEEDSGHINEIYQIAVLVGIIISVAALCFFPMDLNVTVPGSGTKVENMNLLSLFLLQPLSMFGIVFAITALIIPARSMDPAIGGVVFIIVAFILPFTIGMGVEASSGKYTLANGFESIIPFVIMAILIVGALEVSELLTDRMDKSNMPEQDESEQL